MLKLYHSRLVRSRAAYLPVRQPDWTTYHLDLLRLPIEEVDFNTGLSACDDDQAAVVWKEPVQVEIFAKNSAYTAKNYALANLLEGVFEPLNLKRQRTALFLGGAKVDKPACLVFSRARQDYGETRQEPQSLLGYFHLPGVTEKWRQRLQAHATRPSRDAACRLFWAWLSRLPDGSFRDRYVACILLSIAQRYMDSTRTSCMPRLLVTNPSDCKFIYLYEVEITSKMLEMVSNPTLISKHTSWPTIQCRKVPFEPNASFQKRIIEVLSNDNLRQRDEMR